MFVASTWGCLRVGQLHSGGGQLACHTVEAQQLLRNKPDWIVYQHQAGDCLEGVSAAFVCRYSARARGDVLALKLTQENYIRALAAMYYEAENGARAVANSTTASGRPLPGPSASSPGLLGTSMSSSNGQPGQVGNMGGGMRRSASGSNTATAAADAGGIVPTAALPPAITAASGVHVVAAAPTSGNQ